MLKYGQNKAKYTKSSKAENNLNVALVFSRCCKNCRENKSNIGLWNFYVIQLCMFIICLCVFVWVYTFHNDIKIVSFLK